MKPIEAVACFFWLIDNITFESENVNHVQHAMCRDDHEKTWWTYYQYTNDTLEMFALDLSKASMSHIRHYWLLPLAMGLLSLLESIGAVQDRQFAKTGKSLFLSFFFLQLQISITVPCRSEQNRLFSLMWWPCLLTDFRRLHIRLINVCPGSTTVAAFCSTPVSDYRSCFVQYFRPCHSCRVVRNLSSLCSRRRISRATESISICENTQGRCSQAFCLILR